MSKESSGVALRYLIVIWSLLLLCVANTVDAQMPLPKCQDRPTWIDPPWVNGFAWCLERFVNDDSAGELGYTALAAAPGGTLYAARPDTGQILALTDQDGDGLPESPRVVADGLVLPNGLAYYQDALYISGGKYIYRLTGTKLETLIDDLPSGAGFWTGGLTIGPDKRIYVAIGATCDYCEQTDPSRGAIWSYALDGSDPQQVATGLRQPADVAFRGDTLWTLDSVRDGLNTPDLDEVNRVTPGANFGWPYCVGADNHPDTIAGTFDCSQTIPPALMLPTHSTPIGMAVYDNDAFPTIENDLLVVLHGSYNQSNLEGYALALIEFDEGGNPTRCRVIMPEQTVDPKNPPGYIYPLAEIQYQESGFWPHRPIDVTVSREGWIYLSVGGGQIFALRPL